MGLSIPISTLPNGAIASNTSLAAVDVSTVTENAVVQTLGRVTPNDGGARVFFFNAASTATVDGINVLGTPTTGRWIAATQGFSGVGPVTSSLTGYAESFVLLSGFAPLTYTLPISTNMVGRHVFVKTATTGTVTIRCGNSTDLIVNAGVSAAAAVVTSVTSTLTGGAAFDFVSFGGRWYETDKPWGLI